MTEYELWEYNLKKGQKTIHDVHRGMVLDILKKRKCTNVRLSKHFIDRMVERRIDPVKVCTALHQLADRLCEITFEFEIGFIPYIRLDTFWLKLAYYNQIIHIQTCYEKEAR